MTSAGNADLHTVPFATHQSLRQGQGSSRAGKLLGSFWSDACLWRLRRLGLGTASHPALSVWHQGLIASRLQQAGPISLSPPFEEGERACCSSAGDPGAPKADLNTLRNVNYDTNSTDGMFTCKTTRKYSRLTRSLSIKDWPDMMVRMFLAVS